MEYRESHNKLILECVAASYEVNDPLTACEIWGIVKKGKKGLDQEILKYVTIGIAAELILNELVIPGGYDENNEFNPWTCSKHKAVSRIAEKIINITPDEYDSIMPTPGYGGWLKLTDKGSQLGELIEEKGLCDS